MDATTDTKFQERCQCKKIQEVDQCKHWEAEEHCKAEEAEQRCKAEEEARACAAAEENKKCEEAVAKECTKNNLPCEVAMGVKKRSVCMGCMKLKEKCKWPVVEIAGGSSKQVTLPQGGKKKKRVRKSTMADDKVVVEGWKTGQPEAGGSDVVAEAIHKLTRELTGQLDMLTSGVLKELQDMLGELEVFAANPGELPEEEDMVEEEDLEEVRGKLEGLGPIVNLEEEMEGAQQGENQDKGKGKERVE
ncbi:hypothetical protein ID866_11271 [Astraeus odoratus]|nr:hypothetical protein ID866_11271 [Astraeus odoratus]